MQKKILLLVIVALAWLTGAAKDGKEVNEQWQRCVLEAVDSFPQGGGYYTGLRANGDFRRTAFQGLNRAFQMQLADMRPQFIAQEATPSFCSSATYALLLKALLMWDSKGKISRAAWIEMKPFVGIVDHINSKGLFQDDGQGVWGRANANGPGIAVLVHELKAGHSFTAFRGAKSERNREKGDERYLSDSEWQSHPVWQLLQPGDFVKIFWNNDKDDSGAIIGTDGDSSHEQERGHSVVFLGFEPNGDLRYWSSNGPGSKPKEMGYGKATCSRQAVQRIVITRITNPENFNNAQKILPESVNRYLDELNGKRHSTTAEMLKAGNIKNIESNGRQQ